MLFDNFERQDERPLLPRETLYSHLNRRAGEDFTIARYILEEWLVQIDSDTEREDLLRRFRSGNNEQYHSVIFELYLLNLFKRHGFKFEIHPETANGEHTRPDFLVTDVNGQQFYLEATVVLNASGIPAEPLIEAFVLELDQRPHRDFMIGINYKGVPRQAPSAARAARDIHRWLDSLDFNECEQILARNPGRLPSMEWEERGFTLKIDALPIRQAPEAPLGNRLIGIGSMRGGVLDRRTSVLRKLEKKARHYGQLDKPLIIAIQTIDLPGRDGGDNEDLLYGTSTMRAADYTVYRQADGFWARRQDRLTKRGVSAVWAFQDLTVYDLAAVKKILYRCPDAELPLPQSVLNFKNAQLVDGIHISYEGENTAN